MQRIVVTQHPGVVRWLCSTPRARTFLVAAATLLLLLSAPSATFAGSAYWLSAPATSDWNTAGNWTAGGPPNGPADTASFAGSNRRAVSISANTQVNGIEFRTNTPDPGDPASAFLITANPPFTLTISGFGIYSGLGTLGFVTTADGAGNHASIVFNNSATAVSGAGRKSFTNNGGLVSGLFTSGNTIFNNTSSAGFGVNFNNNGGTVSGANGGATEFEDTSTAARGRFYNNGGAASGAFGGFTSFSIFK